MAKNFKDLTEQEILALAITLEEEDGRIYGEFAQGVQRELSGHLQNAGRNAGGRIGAPRQS